MQIFNYGIFSSAAKSTNRQVSTNMLTVICNWDFVKLLQIISYMWLGNVVFRALYLQSVR